MSRLNGKPARIVYYVPCLTVGGVEKNVYDLAMALPRDRFDPVVLWSCYWGPLGDALLKAGVPVSHIPLNERGRVAGSAEAIRALQPTVFHSFSYRQDEHDVQAAMAAGVTSILTNRPDMRFWDQTQSVRGWETSRNAGTRRITTCSHAIAETVRRVEGVEDSKIRVIHNGVKMPGDGDAGPDIRKELGIGAHARVIGYVANYRPEKGHATLLRAFLQVLDAVPDAHLICCGASEPQPRKDLDALCEHLALRGCAHMLDLQTDIHRIYRSIDLYVHASDTEGFSNALLEAMSHGKPVVATGVGGNVEAVQDGESGRLTPVRDSRRMAESILTLLGDPQLAARMGSAARNRIAERFTFDRMLSGYIDLYREEMAAV